MNQLKLDNKLVKFFYERLTREEALSEMATILYENGYVNDDFKKNILIREERFPTGIMVGDINVALPHTDREYTIKPTIAIGILKDPVIFNPMGGVGEEVTVRLIIMMAIKDNNEQLEMLQKIMEIIQNQKLLKTIIDSHNTFDVVSILENNL